MMKQIIILFALVASVAAGGSVLAQTATMTPSPSPTTSVPEGAPNTGFGTLK